MKLSKFLPAVTFITMFSLLYVYQQTEILRLAYLGQRRHAEFQDSLDKNAVLRYNIERKASLIMIGGKVSQIADFQMPETYRLVKMTNVPENLQVNQGLSRENIFARVFGIKRQAEAKTVNPSLP